MTSQTGKPTIAIKLLRDIWKSKDNQTIKLRQGIIQNHSKSKAGRLVLGLFLCFK